MARSHFTVVMLDIAGVMAMVLGIAGMYGVISYAARSTVKRQSQRRWRCAPISELIAGCFNLDRPREDTNTNRKGNDRLGTVCLSFPPARSPSCPWQKSQRRISNCRGGL